MQTFASGRMKAMACISLTKAFSLQAGSSLSSPACCDNAHRGRADVRCQQHICIQPQSPPLHWPDNGTALLLHLSFPPLEPKKKKKKKERESRELFFENQCPLILSKL